MKAPSFAYARAGTVAEALELLEAHGAGAKILAGGQSLMAGLNLRLSAPALLIDITRIPELSGISVSASGIRIGALTTHAEIENSQEIAARLPLLAQAAPHIAHVAIRNCGTLGGSLALADPAAEWPACCVALDAVVVLASRAGDRRVKARDFFKSVFATELKTAEVITAVEFPLPAPGERSVFLELARRRGDYAIAGVAAVGKKTNGALSGVQLSYLGCGETPVLARAAMAGIEGAASPAAAAAAASAALASDLSPGTDIYTTAAAKLHLARVLTGRALAALAA